MNRGFWRGRRIFLTGHTGFKGGWLATWLLEMGALVTGYSLPAETEPSYFQLCNLDRKLVSVTGDIQDRRSLETAITRSQPEIIFHLAAQPLVRRSYREPLLTLAVNVMGTANVLEIARNIDSVKAIVAVTSDKCYENREWLWGYREDEALGGRDPYSASKACAELVTSAYSRSFFDRPESPTACATARAGNVIGGGDWAGDRLVPDAIRALTRDRPVILRNPAAVRPWQHVLEPLSGYLRLAELLATEGAPWNGAWNFGPAEESVISTSALLDLVFHMWGKGEWNAGDNAGAPHEARSLRLDCSKARELLGWRPRLTIVDAARITVDWYRQALLSEPGDMYAFSAAQIHSYENLMTKSRG